ncbi:hypothetical protein BGZ65_004428 [Modicella reniformis]|uniref:Uncharacterized protein n=1 Tax=Modicella reniformis TaxID=1440133 RepID=A0A9P6M8W9_9FUNG|nr:hypothetical protein BGZ65_004428 [Modicella reniformis]
MSMNQKNQSKFATPIYPSLKYMKKNKKGLTTEIDTDEAVLGELDQDGLADLLGSVRAQKQPRDADSDHEQEATPQSTAPASRAESPDETGGGGKVKKMSAKEKKGFRRYHQSILTCRVNSVDFDSKNQLFAHIKETGRATAPSETAAGSKPPSGSSVQDGFFSSDEVSMRGRAKGLRKAEMDCK